LRRRRELRNDDAGRSRQKCDNSGFHVSLLLLSERL
jgi:hypothetical protein